jgi:phage gpG-like protein
MSKKIKFDTILRKIKSQRKAVACQIANKGVNHFKQSFRDGGFTDEALERWQPRQGEIRGGLARLAKGQKGRRAILVKSGLLRRSIKKIKVTPNSIIVGTNSTTYASYHNQGIGHMPQRKFIGRSKMLSRSISSLISAYVKKAFK